MTLVELLHLAAKSANIDLVYQNNQPGRYKVVGDSSIWVPWAPHQDGNDAMQLVAVHGMQINSGKITCRVGTTSRVLQASYPVSPLGDTSPEKVAQTMCMAITELAADIGHHMS
ncbi:hypothetical protein KKQ11_00390 [Pseudomonas sp. MG-2]|uniref:hypothetical protein n=1 Tax=Pseudomonas sp. MG-2 TaxID=405714 RepID=UPI001C00014C|nr:hypothetical protein [Pseudomonas sp. MG-2]MBT9234280.1 hypothetical protein [Pseudomonas sp. MG-2]